MEKLKAVIFDLDGTIVDVCYDWKKIKEELGVKDKPILFYLAGLKEPERSLKWKILEKHEKEATSKAVLKDGINEFLVFLKSRGIKKALVTNNTRENVSVLMKRFNLEFDCVLSREAGLWKPSGAPFISVLEALKIEKEESCVVGDSHFDVRAARDAGIEKIFIFRRGCKDLALDGVEMVNSVRELQEKIEVILSQP